MSNIIVVGDAMLDEYIYGNTDRKNPESPMPLLNVEKEEMRLGGASNAAHNIGSLNGDVDLIAMVGKDTNGEVFAKMCKDEGINFLPLYREAPTVTKKRFLDSQYKQQLLRVDYERINKKEKISDENIKNIKNLLAEMKPEYILVSDYNKGIVSEEMMNLIKEYANSNGIKVLADVKPKNIEFFKEIFLIKPNFKEFCEIMDIQGIENNDENIAKYGLDFVKQYGTNLVVTRGGKGSTLVTTEGKVYHIPSEERKVFDVTGAGDTYIATLTYALSQGYDLVDAVKLANTASGIVVGKVGTASVTKEELGL